MLSDAMNAKTIIQPVAPLWGDAKAVHSYFGLGRSTLYALVAKGKIRSSSLLERGKMRGKRLFSFPSIEAFVEARATGGEEGPNKPQPDFDI